MTKPPKSSSTQRGEAGWGDDWQPTPVPAALLTAARELRSNMTDTEQLLWRSLRGKQLDGFRFRKQHPCGRYVLDFYCPSVKLAIELDGGQHNSEQGKVKDAERTEELAGQGIRVVRFWNSDVLNNLAGILERIRDVLHESSTPPPQPSPAGGGS